MQRGRVSIMRAAISTGDGSYVQLESSAAGSVPFAMSDFLVRSYRLVVRVVLLQAGCAALAASAFLVFKGAHQAIAALVGGLIVAAGSAVFGWRAFKPGMAGGAKLNWPNQGVPEKTAQQGGQAFEGLLGALAWPALLRKLDRIDPSYKH